MLAVSTVQKRPAGLGKWTTTKACRLAVLLTALTSLSVAVNSLTIVADGRGL
jgi:hypothetical protein